MNKKPLIVLFGPTASGKTKMAVEICKNFNGEVVTADSMQVYKHMNIGTAKPCAEEMQGIKHYMIDVVEPWVNYSLADYVADAKKAVDEVYGRGKIPVLAGGTGLYIDTLINGISLSESKTDGKYRKELFEIAEKKGNSFLHKMLEDVDKTAAENIHENNVKRVIRALEVYKETGVTITEHNKKSQSEDSPYKTIKLCLTCEREMLYERINSRVDEMIKKGLVDEVENLLKMGVNDNCTSMQGIGYKEFFPYIEGKTSLEDATELLKQSTRRYAKRQITWFKREENTEFIENNYKKAEEIIKNYGKNCFFDV